MLKLFKRFLSTKELTVEEKIAQAEKKYSGMELVTEILKIEGFEARNGLMLKTPEEWYLKFVDLCAKYKVDFLIPC